jgi:hypothetical protein
MMKTRLIIFSLLCLFTAEKTKAQVFGNEWIKYDQQYLKIPITQSGFYKITYDDLVGTTVPINSISVSNIQMFGRDKEIPLFEVVGTNDTLNSGEFIAFYADKNDGWLDKTLYEDDTYMSNPYYSLYNDTIYYFLSWNNSTNNLRYELQNDNNFSDYTPAPYILWEGNTEYHTSYSEGFNVGNLSTSFYIPGEGYMTGAYTNGSTPSTALGPPNLSVNFDTRYVYKGLDAPLVYIKSSVISLNRPTPPQNGGATHHSVFRIGSQDSIILDTTFADIKQIYINSEFNSGSLIANTTSVKWKVVNDLGIGTNLDRQSIGHIYFKYPRQPNLGLPANPNSFPFGKFLIPNSLTASKTRLDLSGLTYSNPLIFVEGEKPMQIRISQISSGKSQGIIPNSLSEDLRIVRYADSLKFKTILSISPVTSSGLFTNFTNIPDSALLMVYPELLEAGAIEYSNYRKSNLGGSYNVVFAKFEELFLQYGGGIPKHINGVRRFAHQAYEGSSQKPAGLFLMGKGVREAPLYQYVGTGSNGARFDAVAYSQSLIPSFGQPSSDLAITASLIPSNWAPLIPTGRISVTSNDELLDYLNKIKEYDLQQDQGSLYSSETKDWQKQVLHFGGGSNAVEQTLFKGYLENMEKIIEGGNFGGNVTKLYKSTSAPFDPTLVNEISDRLSSGISFINFFGHANSQTSGFEINIDNPATWNNQGRYPIVFANTCFNGNIFAKETTVKSTSEDFVRVPNSGAIAFVSSVFLSYSNSLGSICTGIYDEISNRSYGQTLGKQMQNNAARIQSNYNGVVYESNTLQYVLNGDPMIRPNFHNQPEFEILEKDIAFNPTQFDLTLDSVEIEIQVKNLGRASSDTINLYVNRNFPNSINDSNYFVTIEGLAYQKEIKIKMPLQASIGAGLNIVKVQVDIPSIVEENYDEILNNKVSKNLFINLDGVNPITPSEYSVIPDQQPTLFASTIDPIASLNNYVFELDTTDLFNSPFKRTINISSTGGVIELKANDWKLSSNGTQAGLNCTDSAVYFWRAAIQENNPNWIETSFQYIENKTGWGQDHFFQFKKNSFSQLTYDRALRQKQFFPDSAKVEALVNGNTSATQMWQLNGNQQEYGMCFLTPQIQVAVIDPRDYEAWGTHYSGQNANHSFGNYNDNGACRQRSEKYFIFFQNSAAQLANFQNMVLNEIPDGFYVLISFPYFGPNFANWTAIDSAGMYGTFNQIGSNYISANSASFHGAIFYQKGNPSSLIEKFGQNTGDDLSLVGYVKGRKSSGTEKSTFIGPAKKWTNFYWKLDPLEANSNDTTTLDIEAYSSSQQFQFKVTLPLRKNDSIINLQPYIDASSSPFIKLSANYSDSVENTPSQLDRWHVLYDPLPEAAIDGSKGYLWSAANKDTLAAGEDVSFAIDVKNIFSIDMDSLLISYYIENDQHVNVPIPYTRQQPLMVGEIFKDTISFSTTSFAGSNVFWMEVNPYVNGTLITDQPEQLHFNNILQIPFYVRADEINPILDVTFDGRHILNGDIINPYSEILITLKDENPYLIMNESADTSLFGIYLTNPSGIQTRIPFEHKGQTVMQWVPADAQNKKFKIVYPGAFEQDGKYTLSVQGSDKSGNLSGDLDYLVTFEVVKESSITHMMNYPNPFSTSTRFVFTLTGSEIPDDLIIQIMTINGKIVREITEQEFGRIHIGRNISEFAWNGTDEFGDRLANGVYLYRVMMKMNGEDIKRRETGGDQYFTKDFGKMYLMR